MYIIFPTRERLDVFFEQDMKMIELIPLISGTQRLRYAKSIINLHRIASHRIAYYQTCISCIMLMIWLPLLCNFADCTLTSTFSKSAMLISGVCRWVSHSLI